MLIFLTYTWFFQIPLKIIPFRNLWETVEYEKTNKIV